MALALLALWLLSAVALTTMRLGWPSRLGRIWRSLDRVDAVVGLALAVWWIVAPAHIDDGWIWAQNRIFADFAAVTFYFDFWGVIAPLGYWPTWLGHWAIGSTTDLVFMRLPVLGLLAAAWFVCRSCLRLALGGELVERSRWVLAAAYLVGAVAWGMTLRPEPVVALLAVVSLWAMLSFARTTRISSLAAATIAIALALSAHPTGLVAAAPLIAAAPLVFRTLRASRLLAATFAGLSFAALALIVVLATLDTDLSHLLVDAAIARTGDTHAYSIWDEYLRYTQFDEGAGLPLLKFSLAFMLASVIAVLARVRSVPVSVSLLPARSVAIGLVSLAFIPSKWPWHFGALVAIAAVATQPRWNASLVTVRSHRDEFGCGRQSSSCTSQGSWPGQNLRASRPTAS